MPKGRYKIMRAYMPKKGALGLDMMLRTCTVQVNLDFASEADMVEKFRVAMALQPVAVALFANSPFSEGRPNGFLSYRSHVWTDTDPDRCGISALRLRARHGLRALCRLCARHAHVLRLPRRRLHRCKRPILPRFHGGKTAGTSRRAAAHGRLDRPSHHRFPRGAAQALSSRCARRTAARGGSLCALPALWVGLLYDSVAQDAAWQLVKDWTLADHEYLRREVPRAALKTPFKGRTHARAGARRARARDRRLGAPRARRKRFFGREPVSRRSHGRPRAPAARPPRSCSRPIARAGARASSRSSASSPIEGPALSGAELGSGSRMRKG